MTAQRIYQYPFKSYEPIVGETIQLVQSDCLEGRNAMDQVPAYVFDVCLHNGRIVGQVDIRMGLTPFLEFYGGQIGYGILERFRGNHFAQQACYLLKQVAQDNKMKELWITCNPDNRGSVKTCNAIGARWVSDVNVPKWCELYRRGDRIKSRYLWQF